MNPKYKILIYSNVKNTSIVGLASNANDNLLYLVTIDPNDAEKLIYSPLTIIDGSDSSLVTHEHHGLMSKEDKILFDKLTSYMDRDADALKFTDEGASITLSENEVSLSNGNTTIAVSENKSEISYTGETSQRSFTTDAEKLSYKAVTQLIDDKDLERNLTWTDFSLITSSLTESGVILTPIDTGVLRDVIATQTIDTPTYGDMYIDVFINSAIAHRGAIILIKDHLTQSVLGSLSNVDKGYREYQIPFFVKSSKDKIDISIYSYRESKIQYGKFDLIYPERRTDFNVGESLDFTSKDSSKFEIDENELTFKNETKRTVISTDILDIFRENIGNKIVLDTTDKGVGFFDKSDYTLKSSDFTTSEIQSTWK